MALHHPLTCQSDNSIFESNDALKRYLQDARERREQRKLTRQERERLNEAIALVTTELDAAKQDDDAEIALELETVLQQFTQRLLQLEERSYSLAIVHSPLADAGAPTPSDTGLLLLQPTIFAQPISSLPPTVAFRQTPPLSPIGIVQPEEGVQPAETSLTVPSPQPSSPSVDNLRDEILIRADSSPQCSGLPPTEYAEIEYADAIVVTDWRGTEEPRTLPQPEALIADGAAIQLPLAPEVVPLSEEQRSARLETLTAELNSIETRWREIDAESLSRPEGGMHRPRCLQTRALACELGGLNARAQGQGVGKELRGAITSMRERMELARAYGGDAAPCLPFDPAIWSNVTAQLSEDDWAELADLYAAAAVAQNAYEWYKEHREPLENGLRWSLLNAIAAAQQRLFCVLEEFDSKDRLQADLYIHLRAAADTEGYLPAMNPDMGWAERESIAAQLPQLLQNAQRVYTANVERKAKEARKAAAIAGVLEWREQSKAQALSKYTLDKQKLEIARLLDECLSAGIPPTNVQIRSALLETGPLLLEKLVKYSKFLDAILTERKRKGLDATEKDASEDASVEEEDEPADSQMENYRQVASLFSEGQKLLILGGVPRQRVCEELEQLLACAEVKWPNSKKSDRAGKFQGDINRADILIVVKNFASHEMTEKGRDWMRAQGKPFILLPSGYGVNQIIHQLYNYATLREGSNDLPTLITTSTSPTFQLT